MTEITWRAGEWSYLELPSNYGDVMGVVVSSSGADDPSFIRNQELTKLAKLARRFVGSKEDLRGRGGHVTRRGVYQQCSVIE